MTSTKPTPTKKFIESLATSPSKIRKITLAALIVAVSFFISLFLRKTSSF